MAKLYAKRCPTCGANIQVPPHAPSVQCRYCGNLITVAHQKPPPMQTPGIPSTTLYIDPEEVAKAGRQVATIVTMIVLVTVLLPLAIGVGPWACSKLKSTVRPFPAECAVNETIEMSGDWTGTGPVITSAGHNCKIKITKAKLKGTTLLKTSASNVEITLEDVTIETTGPVVQGEGNLKINLVGSTLTSTGDAAIKATHNLKLDATASKITGKKAGIDVDSNPKLTFKKGTEITSAGTAIKAKSSLVLEAEGGKITGEEAGIEASSNAKITATGLAISAKEKALLLTSSATLDLTDGSVTSLGDTAIETASAEISLEGTKVQGTASAITGSSSFKLKATKKASLVATTGDGIEITSGANITFVDATLDAAKVAIKSTSSTKVKLSQGTRITGKKGGIIADSSFDLDATDATIDGGGGPGIEFDSSSKVDMQKGVLKGTPALKANYKPASLSLAGTRVEGDQQIPKR